MIKFMESLEIEVEIKDQDARCMTMWRKHMKACGYKPVKVFDEIDSMIDRFMPLGVSHEPSTARKVS